MKDMKRANSRPVRLYKIQMQVLEEQDQFSGLQHPPLERRQNHYQPFQKTNRSERIFAFFVLPPYRANQEHPFWTILTSEENLFRPRRGKEINEGNRQQTQ